MSARVAGALLAVALAASSGCQRRPAAPPLPASAAGPRLVVLIVIDQLPRWGFDQRRVHYRDGLARLLREGTLLTGEFPYTGTSTAPGHAVLATGAPPSVHGVIANAWYRRARGGERLAETDDAGDAALLPLGDRAPAAASGASSRALRVPALADALRAATGGRGRSIAIAGKPRSACFVLGRADLALWYEPSVVGFTTSRAFAAAVPPWLVALDRARPLDLDDVWEAGDPALLAAATGVPDDAPGEGGEYGAGITFPHALAATTDPARALRTRPALERAEVDVALAAITGERLGADDVPDLLAVSFSAHDYVGHAWGQESWEMLDLEQRLDRELGRLLDGLDHHVGAGRYAVVLTSDHGATPLIERGAHPGARRLPPRALEATGETGAATVLGAGDWVAAVSSSMVYASAALRARPPAEQRAALAAIAAALAAVPGVGQVIDLDALPADCATLTGQGARACRSRVAGESGELLIVPAEGSLVTGATAGTSHDAPSDDNRQVPLLLVTPDRRPLITAADPPVSMLRVAPTIAALLGIAPPAAAREPALVPLTAAAAARTPLPARGILPR